LRGAWRRRDLTFGLGLVVAAATATAVAAPTFAGAASSALVRERVAVADPLDTDLSWAISVPSGSGGMSSALKSAHRVGDDLSLYDAPVVSASALVDWTALDAQRPAALAWHQGQCDQVTVVGRCPDRPGEVLLPADSTVAERYRVGDRIVVREPTSGFEDRLGPAHQLTVVGTWQPQDVGAAAWYAPSRWEAGGQVVSYSGCDSSPTAVTMMPLAAPLLTDATTLGPIAGRTVLADAALSSTGDIGRLRTTAAQVERWQTDGHAETEAAGVCAAAVSDSDIDGVLGPIGGERDRLERQGTGAAAGAVLIGVLATVLISTLSARRRRYEFALAKLRGVRGLRLGMMAINEPAVAVLAGAAVGVLAGWGVAGVAARAWLGSNLETDVPASAVPFALLVVGFALIGVAAGAARTLREPIHLQLRPERPRQASGPAYVARMAVFVGAALGIYQLRRADPSDPPWWSLSLPVVVGLAAGLIAVWVIRWAAGVATAVSRQRRGDGIYLASRRLLRSGDLLAVVPFVVAAIVLTVVASAAWGAGVQWRDSTALLRTGGPIAIMSDQPPQATLAATRRADPDGDYLMTAVSVEGESSGVYRRLFVDTTRWDRVLAPDLSATSTDVPSNIDPGVVESLHVQGQRDPGMVSGSRLAVSVDLDATVDGASTTELAIKLVDAAGRAHVATASLALHGRTSRSFLVPYCQQACDLESITIEPVRGYAVYLKGRVTIERLRIGDTDLMTKDWRPESPDAARFRPTSGGGLTSVMVNRPVFLEIADDGSGKVPVVVTAGLDLSDPESVVGQGMVLGIGGTALPARTAGTVGTLPMIGDSGVLGDLTTFLDSEPFAAPLGDVTVIARADTPDSVYAALADAGIDSGDRATIGEARQLLDDDPFAQALRFFWLAAGLVAVIALCAVATALVSQRPTRAQESAALRVAGLRRRQLRSAVVIEVTAVAAFVAACGWLAAWLSTWATLPALPLGEPGAYEPAPDPVITWSSGIVPALAAAITVAAVAVGLLLPITLRSRPASLRGGGD